jgi:dipeptidyl aminopeptidase/acylaminoacyl peptidase
MKSSRMFPACLCLGVVFAAAPMLRAGDEPKPAETKPTEPHFPTTEDLRHIKTLGGPQLSPDGKLVLFVVTDATADGAKSHVWVVSASGEKESLRQLTVSPPADKRGERAPEWAPDGSAVFFLAKRGEHMQLLRLDMRGGEAMPYELKVMPAVDESKEKNAIPPPGADKKDAAKKADAAKAGEKKPEEKKDEPIEIDVNGYAISPDGKWLAVWARDPETPGEKKQADAKADAVWVNHEKHGTRLYLAQMKPDGTLDGGLKVVAIEPDVRSAVWSQASDKLLVTTEAPNDLSDLGPAGKAFVVDAASPDKAQQLSAIPATVGGVAFSPDESTIVFAAATKEDAPPGYDELYALPKETTGSAVVSLSAGFAGQLYGGPLTFLHDGGVIANAGMGTHATPVRLTLDGSKPPKPIDLGAPVINGLNTNRAKTGWVWTAESGGQPEKLCAAAKLGDACRELPIPELEPKGLMAVEPELVKWTSGGFTVEGLMYLPPEAKAGKVPLIVDVHGGPFGAFENRHDPYAAFFLGHGWAVFRPNPRGSSNYGVKFEQERPGRRRLPGHHDGRGLCAGALPDRRGEDGADGV